MVQIQRSPARSTSTACRGFSARGRKERQALAKADQLAVELRSRRRAEDEVEQRARGLGGGLGGGHVEPATRGGGVGPPGGHRRDEDVPARVLVVPPLRQYAHGRNLRDLGRDVDE